MNLRDKLILQLYFPNFKSPPSSRFESLFIFLNKNDSNIKKKNIISYEILPDRIMQGEDKRTNINFLSISKDQNIDNFIIAYLNVINYKSIVPIYMGLRKQTFDYFGKKINIEICYSKIQGKDELKKVFKNEYFGK